MRQHVASVIPPGPKLGGVLEVYRGWQPCIDWCWEQFENSTAWNYVGEGVFEFEREQDCVWFLMKWG
jgi:hypothetical protein